VYHSFRFFSTKTEMRESPETIVVSGLSRTDLFWSQTMAGFAEKDIIAESDQQIGTGLFLA